jgi:SAM-dependent methyltransferase
MQSFGNRSTDQDSREALTFDLSQADCPIAGRGLSGSETEGRWTDGPTAELNINVPTQISISEFIILKFQVRAFTHVGKISRQRVIVYVNGVEQTQWSIAEGHFRYRICVIDRSAIKKDRNILVCFDLPDHTSPSFLSASPDFRSLGIMLKRVAVGMASELPAPDSLVWQYGRAVGGEASKTFDQRIESGFWARFITGKKVLDIGFRGYDEGIVPIFKDAIGVDTDYPGYDGKTLPFEDGSQDAVFSSHCLEHIGNYINAIQEWYRVIKVGGHVITAVPSAALYERKRRPPSRWNDDHKRFYTPGNLLAEFEAALQQNSYRVRFLEENDLDYRYVDDTDLHPYGSYEIVLVIEKIFSPKWKIES